MGKSNSIPFLKSGSTQLLEDSPLQGAIAPSYTERFFSGMTKSGSIPSTFPKPSQVRHAPNGLLNEKKLTDGISNCIPSSSKRSEKLLVSCPGTVILQSP